MKKYFVSLMLLAMSGMPAVAQQSAQDNAVGYEGEESQEAPHDSIPVKQTRKTTFGLRAAGDWTLPGDLNEKGVTYEAFNSGEGLEFGVVCTAPIGRLLFIEPGLKLFYTRYGMSPDYMIHKQGVRAESVSIRKFGMRIPVSVGLGFTVAEGCIISVFTGPELEIGFSANAKVKKWSSAVRTEDLYSDYKGLNRTVFQWRIGAGIAVGQLYCGIYAGFGLSNMVKNSYDTSFHENRLAISLGVNF